MVRDQLAGQPDRDPPASGPCVRLRGRSGAPRYARRRALNRAVRARYGPRVRGGSWCHRIAAHEAAAIASERRLTRAAILRGLRVPEEFCSRPLPPAVEAAARAWLAARVRAPVGPIV